MCNELYSFTIKVINMKMAMYKEVASLERCRIITPLADNENCDVYNNDAEQYINILDEENLQLSHSNIDDSDHEGFE